MLTWYEVQSHNEIYEVNPKRKKAQDADRQIW